MRLRKSGGIRECIPNHGTQGVISRDLIWNGKTAPSSFLHKQLDITQVLVPTFPVTAVLEYFSP
jgi:hypothetical protein